MAEKVNLGEMAMDVVFKDIKNVHLSVYPPNGRVRISAPRRMSLDQVRLYAISRLGWIKKHQKRFREQERETPREYLDRESHWVWGKRYLLEMIEANEPPSVELVHGRMIFSVRPETEEDKKREILDAWYREQVKQAAPHLMSKWEPLVGAKVNRFFVQRMKTKWGSCNPATRSIRLNTELAKKPRECLEYIVVHEMVHFLEPTHNSRFVGLMDRLMPQWPHRRQKLNELPVRHEEWTY